MIFEHTKKWDGKGEIPLTLSQIKQIAGRAGRFGLHGDDSSGGVVTSMRDEDLPLIRAAIAAPMEPLRKARLQPPHDKFMAVVRALPPGTPLSVVPWLFHYVGKHHPKFALVDPERISSAYAKIDAVAEKATVKRRHVFNLAPIRWRDPNAMIAAQVMLRLCTQKMHVKHVELLETAGMMDTINEMRAVIQKSRSSMAKTILPKLESIHGTLVTYLWFHYRLPVTFSDRQEVLDLKHEIEHAMQWCLERLSAKHRPWFPSSDVPGPNPSLLSPTEPGGSGKRVVASRFQRSECRSLRTSLSDADDTTEPPTKGKTRTLQA